MPTFTMQNKVQGYAAGEHVPGAIGILHGWYGVCTVPEMPKGCSVSIVALAEGQITNNERALIKAGYRCLEDRVPNPVHQDATKCSFYIKEMVEDV